MTQRSPSDERLACGFPNAVVWLSGALIVAPGLARGRLIRHTLTESLVFTGAAVSLFLAGIALRAE